MKGNFFSEGKKDVGKVFYRTNQYMHGNKGIVDLLYSTKNPITPEVLTPSVDVNARYVFDYNKKKNQLTIAFTVKSDGYPSIEAIIEDQGGNRMFLGVSKEGQGTPGNWLFGGTEIVNFSKTLKIQLDENGLIKSVIDQSYNLVEYKKDQWNMKKLNDFKN